MKKLINRITMLQNLQSYLPEPFNSMPFNELRKVYDKFLFQKSHAKSRKIEFKFQFKDWIDIWAESGKWYERGHGAHRYVMARFNDEGAYEIGNVKIITHSENLKEGHNIGEYKSNLMKEFFNNNPEVRTKLREGMKKHYENNPRRVMTPMGLCNSNQEAAELLGICIKTLQTRKKTHPTVYYNVKDKHD